MFAFADVRLPWLADGSLYISQAASRELASRNGLPCFVDSSHRKGTNQMLPTARSADFVPSAGAVRVVVGHGGCLFVKFLRHKSGVIA